MHEIDQQLNQLAEHVIGAAIEAHRHLGPGFLESTYPRASSIELHLRGLTHEIQTPVSLSYKSAPVGEGRLDLLVEERLVVERKAVDRLAPLHKAQVISHPKATRLDLGLLINFNVEALKDGVHHVVYTQHDSSASSAPLRFHRS